MKNIFKKISLFLLAFSILIPFFSLNVLASSQDVSFKARVVEVIAQEDNVHEDGSIFTQQNLKLKALEGEREGDDFIYTGISEIEVADAKVYRENDKVFVDVFVEENGNELVYLTEYDRSSGVYLLIALFVVVFIAVGRFKGFKSLISLILSFVVIIKFIIPRILAGNDPFLISLIGGLFIMGLIIYLTEGWKKKSHLAVLSVLISLLLTLALSIIFTNLTRLTGMSNEEAIYLIGLGEFSINFKGLLLAGMLIGAIGVLDDIIIGQIETVERIREANSNLPPKKVFELAYKIGNTHLGSMVNTLFLTYAGAALPLLLIFSIGHSSGLDLSRNLNSELITTEIVRTLVGSIGVIASMPIATFFGAYGIKKWTKS